MKSISLFIVASLLIPVWGSAQDSALPPLPGLVTPPQAGKTAEAKPDQPTPAPSADDSIASVEAGVSAPEVSDSVTTADSGTDESAPAVAPVAPPGDTPPVPGSDPKKVDFLQRSNLILAKLLENERSMDPFGLVMDPANAKAAPVLADQYEELEETPQINSSSLKSALMTLPITGIYPQREILVLGARTFEVGGQFGMKLQDLTIRLRFEGIRDGEIFFKDMETREVTSIPFNPRPAEFEPMAKGSKREPGEGISSMSDLFIAN